MKTIRRTSLYLLQPVVEFSFKPDGAVYTLKGKRQSKRGDRFTLTIRKKGERSDIQRHYTSEQIMRTFVCLRDNPQTSNQPKYTQSLIINCM